MVRGFTAVLIHALAAAGTRPRECRPGTCRPAGDQRGQELEHLKLLLRWADHRGSDVRLLKWRAAQHINVLELTTLLNFLRMRVATGEVAGKRIFHIFDSLVAASVAA